jgi:DeoR/GlpR family transcriptional regulator of sugar metabolism
VATLENVQKVPLSNFERQERICEWIEKKKRIAVAQICDYFNISEATARRDLELLSEQGRVQRVHGGAITLQKAPPEKPLLERSTAQSEEKRRIGRIAADLIADGKTIFLGSGTTVHEVAKNLHTKQNLTVITNSLLVINELADEVNITIISIGGILRKSEHSFIGHITEQALAELRADMVVMGIRAISLDQGLTNDYLPETMTDRAIMGMGKELIIVADQTKCERVSTVFVAPLENIHTLIITKEASNEFIQSLNERGVKVLLA